jgi:hypothetical protein
LSVKGGGDEEAHPPSGRVTRFTGSPYLSIHQGYSAEFSGLGLSGNRSPKRYGATGIVKEVAGGIKEKVIG